MEMVELIVNLILLFHKVRTGKIRVLADMSEPSSSGSSDYASDSYEYYSETEEGEEGQGGPQHRYNCKPNPMLC